MNELIDGTLADAIELLSKRAAFRRICPMTPEEKQALDSSDVITKQAGLEDYLSGTARSALLGAGIGTGLGALGTHFGNMKRDPDSRRSVLQGALLGGATGGALGGGIGKLKNIVNDAGITESLKPKEGPEPTIDNARNDVIDTIKNKINELKDGLNSASAKGQQLLDKHVTIPLTNTPYEVSKLLPVSSRLLPGLAAADTMLHGKGFGLARLQRPDLFGGDQSYKATGRIGAQMLDHGLDSSTAKALDSKLVDGIKLNAKSGVQPTSNSATSGETFTSNIPHKGDNIGIKEQLLQGNVKPTNDKIINRETWTEKVTPGKGPLLPNKVKPEFAPGGSMTGHNYKDIMRSGNEARMANGGRAAMQVKVPFLGTSAPRITYQAPTMKARMGVYAGIPLLEGATRHFLGDEQGNLNIGKNLANTLFSTPTPQTDIGRYIGGIQPPATTLGAGLNGKQ